MASRYNTRSRRVAGSAAEPALGPRAPGAQPNLTDPNSVSGSEARLRAVSRRGKLAHWFNEYGEAE